MNKQLFLNLSLSLLLLAPLPSPALAEDINIKTIKQKTSYQSTNIEAIIVKFPNDIEFDVGGKKKLPVVLRTVEPVLNHVGKVIVPANSRVEAVLVPVDKATIIVAKSLIMNGKSYPLHAATRNKIPANKITKKSRMEQANTYSSSVARLSPVYNNLTGSRGSQQINKNAVIIQGVGAIVGFLSPRSMLASIIPQNSEHILHLEKPLSLNRDKNTFVLAPTVDK
ncbi:hypothetical protein Riv7116_4835 [Rivularia sp. PCC 7116]|uniref:hypothetical protein n=1 Tax=Rivularia sp. PCC 7116 TaxID=373994 RepID=UPI00029F462F|nr:hypothetical protein [Rivularia sp. PCC 7116]AFY57246.1 hypothetical protein Riv7116_4835 [Rivularia sp. PCC 7116]